MDVGRQLPHPFAVEEPLGLMVREASDHALPYNA